MEYIQSILVYKPIKQPAMGLRKNKNLVTFTFECRQSFSKQPRWQRDMSITVLHSTFLEAKKQEIQLLAELPNNYNHRVNKVLPEITAKGVYEFLHVNGKYKAGFIGVRKAYFREIKGWVIAEGFGEAHFLLNKYRESYPEI